MAGRITLWQAAGLEQLCYFGHRDEEQESPAPATHFIERLNAEIGSTLRPPKLLKGKGRPG